MGYGSDRQRIEAVVVLGGAVTMGIEMLAGRMVEPVFGSSIYTWGSIIGVFMAALAAGYYTAGKRAETHAGRGSLATLFAVSATYVALLLVADTAVISATLALPLPSRLAALPALVILFGLPVYLFGFISPYAAELTADRGTGEASGRIYSLGTAGSILGVFATTFVLIPSLPVTQIMILFGGLLVAAALIIAPREPRYLLRGGMAAAILIMAVLAVSLSSVVPSAASGSGELVYSTQTPYQDLSVYDRGGVRTLYLNGHPQSSMYLNEPTANVWPYTAYFHLPFLMTEDIERVLFIGGGGFTGPKQFEAMYDVEVDVVEIDPGVIYAAREYFDVQESPTMTIYNQDGRTFLRETDTTYDLIVLDAYQKDRVPFHMTTVEFMELARDRLEEDGVLIANLISQPDGRAGAFYFAQYRTIQEVFPTVYAFPTRETGLMNIEIFATAQPKLSEQELRERNTARPAGFDLSEEIGHYTTPDEEDISDVQILRDEYAPVDDLLERHIGIPYAVE